MFFKKTLNSISKGLAKTRKVFSNKLSSLFKAGRKINPEFIESLEDAMLAADMGIETVTNVIDELNTLYKDGAIKNTNEVLPFLKQKLISSMKSDKNATINYNSEGLTIIMVVGVNGVGKTTSIAKLANILLKEDKRVMLAAADTFRAAAIEQLTVWAERLNIGIIKHQHGADQSAVVFDAIDAALARKIDVLIIDTAGRLHTKKNLMGELEKIDKVIKRKIPNGPHETLLVLDATTGQNAIAQAETFNSSCKLTGLIIAKLDGTAKGGIVVAIRNKLNVPVKFIGTGEKIENMNYFNAQEFVNAFFN